MKKQNISSYIYQVQVGFLLLFFVFAMNSCKSNSTKSPSEAILKVYDRWGKEGATEYDLGEIKEGEIAKAQLFIKNEGGKPLNLSFKSSCGCLIASAEPTEVAAGKQATVNIQFNSKGREGAQTKALTIVTNDPNKPAYVIKVKAMVK